MDLHIHNIRIFKCVCVCVWRGGGGGSEPGSCVKVEVAVLSFPSQISLMVVVDIKHRVYLVCEGRGGRPGLPSPIARTVSAEFKATFEEGSVCRELFGLKASRSASCSHHFFTIIRRLPFSSWSYTK